MGILFACPLFISFHFFRNETKKGPQSEACGLGRWGPDRCMLQQSAHPSITSEMFRDGLNYKIKQLVRNAMEKGNPLSQIQGGPAGKGEKDELGGSF